MFGALDVGGREGKLVNGKFFRDSQSTLGWSDAALFCDRQERAHLGSILKIIKFGHAAKFSFSKKHRGIKKLTSLENL